MQPVATYRTAEGETKTLQWVDDHFEVDAYPMSVEQVLEWDAAGTLAWVSPETQAWARALAVPAPAPAAEPASEPAPDPAAAPDSRLALLGELLETLGRYPNYTAAYGTDTDLTVDNTVALAAWPGGRKKVEFRAIMKAVEAERTLYYWEMLKEKGGGLSFGGIEKETYTVSGTKRSGSTSETVIGPGGVVADYDWDYGRTRAIIEPVCTAHGYRLKVVLMQGAAKY
ncbi:MAG: hypothetical protein U1E08_09050 [Coriobacteriia bacterium]|nr:hypothetical protein [Coriobacteriia bacterium]